MWNEEEEFVGCPPLVGNEVVKEVEDDAKVREPAM
jgi:hypothetical protein